MRRGDLVWGAVLAVVVGLLAVPVTRTVFMGATRAHPYFMGFCKFGVLATLGELLGLRIRMGRWKRPVGLGLRVVVWGGLGMSLVLVFEVFSAGVVSAMNRGFLPGGSGMVRSFATAFWISAVMNVTFAPTMMAGHRMTDSYIELTRGRLTGAGLADIVARVDWPSFFGFVVVWSIPLFWIPAHTLTFLLPPEYRVLAAAFLSIALGAILAFAARPGMQTAKVGAVAAGK